MLLVGQLDEAYNFGANPYPFRKDSSVLYCLGLTQPHLAAQVDIDSGDATLVVDAQSDEDRISCTRATPEALIQGRPVYFLPSIGPGNCNARRIAGTRSDSRSAELKGG